ncbi:hypothetical protein ACLB2K_005417 [Fragaria x ananassa]
MVPSTGLLGEEAASLTIIGEGGRRSVDGLPCYIALPDSDAYIDEIDWSNSRTSINPEPPSNPWDESGEDSGDDNSSVDNEEDVDHKEAADIAGFENDAWNKLDHKMLQELMMGLMLESPLW